ncbi:PAS domain-containing protein [Tsuneonella sp. HG222]
MDTLRGNFEALDNSDFDAGDEEVVRDTPPAAIGQDERRMQVRAYNHWASLLEDRNFPGIDGFDPADLPDFGPYSVLLDFTSGIEDPGITFLGQELAGECDVTVGNLRTLADVPSRSLLSRITDHYMQILANQAPIGFEAEFVNQRASTILYRGILLPFSTDDERIDFIYGVINWKELADQHTSDELLLQVDQALEQKPEIAPHRADDAPMTDWADGPGALVANDTGDEEPLELTTEAGWDEDDESEESPIDYAKKFNLSYDDDDYDEDEGETWGDEGEDLPRPAFGSLTSIGASLRKSEPRATALPELPPGEDDFRDIELDQVDAAAAYAAPAGYATNGYAGDDFSGEDFAAQGFADDDFAGAHVPETDSFGEAETGLELPAIDPSEMELGDWLAVARETADLARTSEDRTRATLYDAIGRAYDFSLAAQENPADFDEIVVDAGLTVQERAPLTPVVKLVFGADYDKTRLTEYATALGHAHRIGLPRGGLGEFLRTSDGGLKAVVAAERRLRKAESGKEPAEDPREKLVAALRALDPVDFADLATDGSEFALVMIRRVDGRIAIVGEVPHDDGLVEKAGKRIVG